MFIDHLFSDNREQTTCWVLFPLLEQRFFTSRMFWCQQCTNGNSRFDCPVPNRVIRTVNLLTFRCLPSTETQTSPILFCLFAFIWTFTCSHLCAYFMCFKSKNGSFNCYLLKQREHNRWFLFHYSFFSWTFSLPSFLLSCSFVPITGDKWQFSSLR